MRILPAVLLAGVAAIAVSGVAAAQISKLHTMTVRLPGGAVEQIRYSGDVAPQVTLSSDPLALSAAWSGAPMFNPAPFAALDRISAEMDRETAILLRQASALQAQAFSGTDGLMQTGAVLPQGASGYSMISSFSGNGACMQSVEITSRGDGQAPQVVRRSSGSCGDAADRSPAAQPYVAGTVRDNAPLIQASYHR